MDKKGFIPIHFSDRIQIINPHGLTAVCTLWSKPGWVIDRFKSMGIDVSKTSSPIAVVGNLYGNGIRELLRNLLYNPQIKYLVCCGKNRSNSFEELIGFFNSGLENCNEESRYYLNDTIIPMVKIRGTNRFIDGLISPDDFIQKPIISYLGDLQGGGSNDKCYEFFTDIKMKKAVKEAGMKKITRRIIPLPNVKVEELPSNPMAFMVVQDDIVSAWHDVLFNLYNFGKITSLKKGNRKELLNLKVLVNCPSDKIDPALLAFGITDSGIRSYQEQLLSGFIQDDVSYSYGNRIRRYFGKDNLQTTIDLFISDIECRQCLISLWDPANDMDSKASPCLYSIFFRKHDNKMTVTANFRTHNALSAWVYNFYGIKAIQDYVIKGLAKTYLNLSAGPITIISNSISIDEKELANASRVIKKLNPPLFKIDSRGYFMIQNDLKNNQIIVQHYTPDNLLIKEYAGTSAEKLRSKINQNQVISDISHAFYLGEQLAKAEIALKSGKDFIQA